MLTLAKSQILKIFLVIFVLGFPIHSFTDHTTFFSVNLHANRCGMFSVFSYVAGILYEFDKNIYAGIEVDFKDSGLYFDPRYGNNWWNYYCEPIELGDKQKATIRRFSKKEYDYFAFYTEKRLSRWQVFDLIQKYIKIRHPIQHKINTFIREKFLEKHVICVHYRGTDKYLEALPVSFEQIAQAVSCYIAENSLENYIIFVASDEMQFINQMENAFPNSVIFYNSERSNNGKPLHYGNPEIDKYQMGEDALIDCILLSQGNYLIRTSSNLSLWSTYFNPALPVLELNQRRKH